MTLLKLLAKTLTKLGDLKNSNAEGRPERPYKKTFHRFQCQEDKNSYSQKWKH